MNRRFPSALLLALALAPAPLVFAQTNKTAGSASSTDEDLIVLSPFEVSTSLPGRYQAEEAASGGRIRANLMDTPATVAVLTRDFIEDVGTLRVLDVAKYVAGVSEATIPNGLDRVNIRGFQSDGRRVDGFSWSDQANYDTVGIERIEVIKGPDALLQPTGVPGGTINLVSKRPQFKAANSITVQAGQYDSNRVELDSTGPLGSSKKLAYRVVASFHDSDGYTWNSFRKSTFVAPSLTWRVANNAQITFRYEYYNFKTTALEGVLVDPSVGTNDTFKLWNAIPTDFSAALNDQYQFRRVESHTGTFFFTSAINDRLSVRVAGRVTEEATPDSGFGWGASTQGGSRNPLTGLWEGGRIYSNSAPYAYTAAPALSHTFNHTGSSSNQHLRYRDLQNDWVYTAGIGGVETTTMTGFAYGFEHQNQDARNWTAKPFSVDNFVEDTTAPVPAATLSNARRRELSRMQFYLTEKAEFFNKRVIASAGVANLSFNGYFGSKISTAAQTGIPGRMYSGDGNETTFNYGLVVKPVSYASLYYGHSESAVPTTNFQSVYDRFAQDGRDITFSVGKQDEFGGKIQLFDNRLMFSVAYYEINQSNYALANPANLTSPPPPVVLPAILTDRVATGWEYQITASLTKSLSLIANYNDSKNRDAYDVPFRGAAEKSGAAYLRYEFKTGRAKGLALSLGANYLGKRAGDQASGFTSASTSTVIIANQPSFYLPARTLVDANASYTRGAWTYRLAVNNLLDKEDYAASQTRTSVYIGNPRNFSGSVTYKF
ncbi:hypothetical protein DB347_06835 [Opitutaceae bacterium EW11]|nr:hypothetical protein DB347_06835 [Opitutaceae bacterium EW11]